jgi:toxin ParE1/3/4
MRLRLSALAETDVEAVFDFLVQESLETAYSFLEAFEAACGQLLRVPEIGAPVLLESARLQGLRRWRVRGFEKVLIFYVLQGEVLLILRVLHGARNVEALLEEE